MTVFELGATVSVLWSPEFWWALTVGYLCPPDMVLVGKGVCLDRLAWPNESDEYPLLGVSATSEGYVPIPAGETWDCESLCSTKARRLCSAREWQHGCEGTPTEKCGDLKPYIPPKWDLVAVRDSDELERLDQHADVRDYPQCVSPRGARMMGTVQEWVRLSSGSYALTRAFWSRAGSCETINTTHAPNWHDYATACRCCKDVPPHLRFVRP